MPSREQPGPGLLLSMVWQACIIASRELYGRYGMPQRCGLLLYSALQSATREAWRHYGG